MFFIPKQVDLILELLKIQLGHDMSTTVYPGLREHIRHASSTNLVPEWHTCSAIIAEQSVDSSLCSHPQYGAHAIFHPVGFVIKLPPEATQYIGWIVAVGATREEAEAAIHQLSKLVMYRLTDE